jgi:hypothetical protein
MANMPVNLVLFLLTTNINRIEFSENFDKKAKSLRTRGVCNENKTYTSQIKK